MKRQRLLRFSCSLAAVLGALACSAPAVDTAPDVGLASEAIRNGTEVPDASRVGLVEISWWRQGQRCSRGSGVMLTNSMLLTAAHVVDERVRNFDCQGADELQLRMHNAGGTDEQLRVFKSGVSAGFPPIRIHPGWDAFLGILLGRIGYVFSGTDGAIVFMDWPTETDPGGPFTVNGTSSLFRRPLTANSTRANWGRTATVYGYGVNFCQSTETGAGTPRFGSFQVHPAPAFSPQSVCGQDGCNCDRADPNRPSDPRCTTTMFAVVQGGGARPTNNTTGRDLLTAPGDSGGPAVDAAGNLLGINQSIDRRCNVAREGYLTSLSPDEPLGVWVRQFLPLDAPPFPIDLDGDGAQDAITIIHDAGQVALDMVLSSAQDVLFDTGIPTTGFGAFPNIPVPASLTSGDFNHDGVDDLMG